MTKNYFEYYMSYKVTCRCDFFDEAESFLREKGPENSGPQKEIVLTTEHVTERLIDEF